MPADRTQVQVLMFLPCMLEHAASVNFALSITGSIDDGFLQLVMTVPAEHVQLPILRNPSRNIFHEFARPPHRGNGKPFPLAPNMSSASFRFPYNLRFEKVECFLN